MDEDEEAFLERLADFPDDYDWGILGSTAANLYRLMLDDVLKSTPIADLFKGRKR